MTDMSEVTFRHKHEWGQAVVFDNNLVQTCSCGAVRKFIWVRNDPKRNMWEIIYEPTEGK